MQSQGYSWSLPSYDAVESAALSPKQSQHSSIAGAGTASPRLTRPTEQTATIMSTRQNHSSTLSTPIARHSMSQRTLPPFGELLARVRTARENVNPSPMRARLQVCAPQRVQQYPRLYTAFLDLETRGCRDRVDERGTLPLSKADSSATSSLESGALSAPADASTINTTDTPREIDGRAVGEDCRCQLTSECLEIVPATFSASRQISKNRPYTVQYRCRHDTCAWTSKVWNLHIRRIESRYSPQLDVSIYHDAEKPYHLLYVAPPLYEWLRRRIGYFPGILDRHMFTLADDVVSRSDIFLQAMAQWQLARRELDVLALALAKIGDGDFGTAVTPSLVEPIWKSFMDACRRWEGSEGKKDHRRIRAEQRRARLERLGSCARRRQGATCCSSLARQNLSTSPVTLYLVRSLLRLACTEPNRGTFERSWLRVIQCLFYDCGSPAALISRNVIKWERTYCHLRTGNSQRRVK
jgi:hypothetical protein